MKMKYVNISSDRGFGIVKHIVLQIEETDTFITSSGIDPGYKILIDCTKHRISATGGHTFNPYHGESALKKSRKMDANESDILGFYVGNVKDIDLLPDEIDYDMFNDLVFTSYRGEDETPRSFAEEIENLYSLKNKLDHDKKYLKVIYGNKQKYNSVREMFDEVKMAIDKLSTMNNDDVPEIKALINSGEHFFDEKGFLEKKPKVQVNFGIVESESLLQIHDFWSTNSKSIVADYIWCRFDALPQEKWTEFSKKNDLSRSELLDISKLFLEDLE